MDPQPSPNVIPVSSATVEKPTAAKTGNKILIICLAAALIIILILISAVIFLIFKQEDKGIPVDNNTVATTTPTALPKVTSTVVATTVMATSAVATSTPTIRNTSIVTICGTTLDTLVLNSEPNIQTPLFLYSLIAERWLDQYKSSSRCLLERLNDFRIETVVAKTDSEFELTYAVSPSDQDTSNWFAGNGIIQGDFIVHKVAFIQIKTTATGYGISSIGTGP